eukprot:3858692-Pyramimonas_sp.AAC.1
MDVEDGVARLQVGQREGQLAIEPPRAAQRAVHRVRPRQQRGHDRVVDLILPRGPHRRQPVDLVEKDDRGLLAARLLEQHLELTLRLPHPLAQHVRALAHEERHLGARAPPSS